MPEFAIISDGPVITECTNLTCNKVQLVDWKELLACPICGRTYDPEDEQPPTQLSYGPILNRQEDETMISRMQTKSVDKQNMRTSFDDSFKRTGIVVLDDKEQLPLSIGQERKRTQRISTSSSENQSRQADHGRTRSRSEYREYS